MIDLWIYFIDGFINKQLGIYIKYFDNLNSRYGTKDNGITFEIYDENDAIDKFKVLVEPSNDYKPDECAEFIFICYYLYKEGYYIEQFPNFLSRPSNLVDFANGDIRSRARNIYGTDSRGNVAWASRKELIDNLKFKKKENHLVKSSKGLKDIFKTISTRNSNFENMGLEEKLQEICNAIENMLKINGNFVTIDYEKYSFGFISEKKVINFRKKTQCFRHADEKSIKERESFSETDKNFCINFGLTICNLIYDILKK
ncbi:MAG: hypothetical protein PHU94_01335 [Bacilli bacterium]|nr:hypothetical protein [Bacilli bacterium]MDD4718862.1 hypothetical protein [Bacilli bacterium]